MIRFMAAHPVFATTNIKYLKSYLKYDRYVKSRSLHKKKWEYLTAKLNGLGPPSRPIEAWKKVWISYKAKVKNKLYLNKKLMEGNPTNYHRNKIIFTPDELIVKQIMESDTTDDVSPIEETCTLDDSQTIEAYVIIDSPSSSGSNTTDEPPVVVKSNDSDFTLLGTTLSLSKCSAGSMATSPPTTSQSDNIKLLEEENEEIEKQLDKLKRKRRNISDEIIDLKQKDLELKGKLRELNEQTLELKCQKVKYKAKKLELKQKELRMKEAAKLQKSINN